MFLNGTDFLKDAADGSVILNAAKIAFYVPASNFVAELSTEIGNTVKTIATLFVDVWPTETSEPELFRIDIPVQISVMFSEKNQVTEDFDGTGTVKYNVYYAIRNEVVFPSKIHVQSIESAKLFINALNGAKLSTDIEYNSILDAYKENARLNGVKFGVPSILIEAMISEMTRDKDDITIPFRIKAGSTGQQKGYQFAKIKNLAQVTSVFAALSFENMNMSIISSVNLTRSGRKQVVQPIEKVIHY